MKILMSKLYDLENEKRDMEERARRGSQVGTGGRSEKSEPIIGKTPGVRIIESNKITL